MKGNQKVIETLNKLLAGELTAIDQYFIHSRMFEDWGLKKLYKRVEHERTEEVDHAGRLIKRILFLEGTPNMLERLSVTVGEDVPAMLRNDLNMELAVVASLREAIACCETASDYQTREILEAMLEDTEEDHAYWLETQLGLIEKVGLQNYLQSQM